MRQPGRSLASGAAGRGYRAGQFYRGALRETYLTGEHMDLERLPEYWQRIDALHKQVVNLPPSHKMTSALTARRIDEAQPAGQRVYFEAARLLSVAMDNHQSLMALLAKHGASSWAPWSLLRPSFDCGLLVCWILDPNDSLERRRRGLQCQLRDVLEQRKHLRSFENVPEIRKAVLESIQARRDKTEPTYVAEALALGTTYDQLVGPGISITHLIPRLSWVAFQKDSNPFFPAMIEADWRMLSGFEHGLGWALMRGSDQGASTEIPGGAEITFSISDGPFVQAAKTTAMFLIKALARFERLHTSTVG